MNTQVIIYAKAGHVPPKDYLELALKNCPSYYGLATRDTSNPQEPVIETVGASEKIALDKLFATLEEVKDTDTLVVLGNMGKEFDGAGDMMPFTFTQVAEQDGTEVSETVLAVAFEGDVPNYAKPGGGHSDEFNMWDSFVFPELMDKFEASSDLPTFYDKIRKSNFQQALLNPVGNRAQFFLLPLVGDPIICSKNELGGEFDWGGTSNLFGWGNTGVIAQAKTAVASGKKRLAGLLGGSAPANQEPPKENPPGVHNVGDVHVDPKTSVKAESSSAKPSPAKAETAVKEPYTMVEIPAKLNGNARNKYIRLFMGLSPQDPLPEGHQSAKFRLAVPNNLVPFTKDRDISTQDQVRQLTSRVKAFQDAGTVTEDAHANASKANADKDTLAAPGDYLPTLSADSKKGAVDLVTDWATRNEKKNPTAVQIQSMESKWPAFSEQMGVKFPDLFKWTSIDIKTLGKKYPDALALAFIEMRRQFVEYNGIPDEKWEQPDVKNPQADTGTGGGTKSPDKVTAPPAPAQPQPAGTQATGKKSRLAMLTGNAA